MSDGAAVITFPDGRTPEEVRAIARDYAARRPTLRRALRVDGIRFAANRGDRFQFKNVFEEWRNVLRLLCVSEDYFAVALYRVRCSLAAMHVPLLPGILHLMCITFFGIRIDDRIVIEEGLYLPHGNVVLGCVTHIGKNAIITPWASIGCLQGSFVGPDLGDNVFVGTHSSILGDLRIGNGARIGAGSVVTHDVPPHTTVAGVPARPVGHADKGAS